MKTALSIDVGGTKIYNTIVNEKGEIIGEIEKHHTPKTFAEIKSLFEEIIKKHENEVDVIAFATCGAVNNTNDGILGSTGNIAKEYPTMDFKKLSSKPVFVENDANCAAWAEHVIGSSKGMAYSIMLTLGTGVGGGIILGNRLYKGKNGAAGEMHFKMRTDKHRRCTCGSWDCFEAYASGTGLKKTAEEISGNPDVTTYDVIAAMQLNGKTTNNLEGCKVENSEGKQVTCHCEEYLKNATWQSQINKKPDCFANARNDAYEQLLSTELAQTIYCAWQNDILQGIIGLANIFDPDCVILSGSMAEFVDIEYLEKEANKEIVTTPFKIVKASAGNYSGMIGAALLALGV